MALQRLTESFSITKEDLISKPFQESVDGSPLQERVQGKSYPCIAVYRVPVSRINESGDKNLNGRSYGKALWENVRDNQKHIWEGCVGLADHPSGDADGSVRDIFAVWHNLGLNESKKTVEADLHLIGPFGKLAEEVIAAGGKLGFSSSGFGELMEDGSTVNPSSYMLERVSDWVLTPSQEVYGTGDMKITHENSNTNFIREKKETTMAADNVNASPKTSKLMERKFREDVKAYLTEAISKKDPKEKLMGLKEVLSYFEEGREIELREEVEAKIQETEKEIENILKEHVKLSETFGVDNVESLKEGVARIAVDKKISDSQSRDWKKVAESLQTTIKQLQKKIELSPTNESYENALSFNRSLRESFLARKRELLEKIETLENQLEGQAAVGNKLKELAESMRKRAHIAESKNKELASKLQEALDGKKAVEAKLTESYKKMEGLVQKYESAPKVAVKPKTSMPVEFTEKKEVESYFQDLVQRHGNDILKYKSKFVGLKTLSEAMLLYTRILPHIQEVAILPGNVSTKERLEYLKEVTGKDVVEVKRELKKPEGWV